MHGIFHYKRAFQFFLGLALISVGTSGSIAQGHGGHGHHGNKDTKVFKNMDTDESKSVTKEEAEAAYGEKGAKWFTRFDINKDGVVTLQEVQEGSRDKEHQSEPSKKGEKKDSEAGSTPERDKDDKRKEEDF